MNFPGAGDGTSFLRKWFNRNLLSSEVGETARFKVDSGETCFDEGRQFRKIGRAHV